MFFKYTFFFVAAELLTSVVYQQYMPTPKQSVAMAETMGSLAKACG